MKNQQDVGPPTDFVKSTLQRGEILELLREGESRDTRELTKELSMSRSTIHRVTESLSEFDLLAKSNGQFEVTGLGSVVAEELRTCRTNLETANRLKPFLNTIDTTAVDIPLERFSDATVTHPRHRQAHVGVKRIIELIEQTDSLRIFSSIISPLYVDVARREILDGTDIEVIFDSEVMDIIVDRYAEEAGEAYNTGRFHVLVGENIPFELFLFDDRMGMAAHDESGIARGFVESTSPEARRWAEEIYQEYANIAETLDQL